MPERLLAPDRVTLLLALIPYLREHGPTPVSELADAFDVNADALRGLVEFLATAGVPGETLSYQHEDLFDIDWDALERDDVVSLTQVVAIEETPRFAPTETAALVAGLQMLTAMLPVEDAELARATAQKLGAALGEPDSPTPLSATRDPDDPQLPVLVAALQGELAVAFDYRSVTGAESSRVVDPMSLDQRGDAWYLRAYCRDRGGERVFRVDLMRGARHAGPRQVTGQGAVSAESQREQAEIVAVLPANRLPLIAGFAPQIVDELPESQVRVRVAAWHDGSAVRLVQESRGAAVIEAPASARATVRSWAQQALAEYDG